MEGIYTTVQGDTWDLIAYKLFGSEKYMKNLIEANWPLLEVLVFSAGATVHVPEISEEEEESLPFWKTGEEGEWDLMQD